LHFLLLLLLLLIISLSAASLFILANALFNSVSKPVVSEACYLTFWRRNFLLNFSTPCISNLNITGTKKGSIMK
jgi:hypothetical protein